MLEHKFLPGTRTGRLEPTRISDGFVGIAHGLEKVGEFAKAVVGDVAAGMRADPNFSGNIPAVFTGEELPMDTALRDAAQEQKFRGEVPIATVMGRISEGLASTAPMIPLMGGLPGAAQKVALAAFTAKMVKDTPEIARQLGEEFGKPPDQRDPNKIDSLVAQAIQTVGFAAAGGVGLKRSLTTGPYSHLPDHPTVEPGKDFTRAQKQKVLDVNAQRNDGSLRSDQSGRILSKAQQSKKGVSPPANEAQIDHITPKSKGGPNSYKNAQVLARDENIKKSNK